MRFPKFEHIYVMLAPFDLPWRAKVGISIEKTGRKTQIEYELRQHFGHAVKVYAIGFPILWAGVVERRIHRFFDRLRYHGVKSTNGGTEWFWAANWIMCIVLSIVKMWLPEKYFLSHLIVLLLPIPLDFILLTLLIFAIQWAAILGGIYWAMWALNLY